MNIRVLALTLLLFWSIVAPVFANDETTVGDKAIHVKQNSENKDAVVPFLRRGTTPPTNDGGRKNIRATVDDLTSQNVQLAQEASSGTDWGGLNSNSKSEKESGRQQRREGLQFNLGSIIKDGFSLGKRILDDAVGSVKKFVSNITENKNQQSNHGLKKHWENLTNKIGGTVSKITRQSNQKGLRAKDESVVKAEDVENTEAAEIEMREEEQASKTEDEKVKPPAVGFQSSLPRQKRSISTNTNAMRKVMKSGQATVAETLNGGAAIQRILAQAQAETNKAKAELYKKKFRSNLFQNDFDDWVQLASKRDIFGNVFTIPHRSRLRPHIRPANGYSYNENQYDSFRRYNNKFGRNNIATTHVGRTENVGSMNVGGQGYPRRHPNYSGFNSNPQGRPHKRQRHRPHIHDHRNNIRQQVGFGHDLRAGVVESHKYNRPHHSFPKGMTRGKAHHDLLVENTNIRNSKIRMGTDNQHTIGRTWSSNENHANSANKVAQRINMPSSVSRRRNGVHKTHRQNWNAADPYRKDISDNREATAQGRWVHFGKTGERNERGGTVGSVIRERGGGTALATGMQEDNVEEVRRLRQNGVEHRKIRKLGKTSTIDVVFVGPDAEGYASKSLRNPSASARVIVGTNTNVDIEKHTAAAETSSHAQAAVNKYNDAAEHIEYTGTNYHDHSPERSAANGRVTYDTRRIGGKETVVRSETNRKSSTDSQDSANIMQNGNRAIYQNYGNTKNNLGKRNKKGRNRDMVSEYLSEGSTALNTHQRKFNTKFKHLFSNGELTTASYDEGSSSNEADFFEIFDDPIRARKYYQIRTRRPPDSTEKDIEFNWSSDDSYSGELISYTDIHPEDDDNSVFDDLPSGKRLRNRDRVTKDGSFIRGREEQNENDQSVARSDNEGGSGPLPDDPLDNKHRMGSGVASRRRGNNQLIDDASAGWKESDTSDSDIVTRRRTIDTSTVVLEKNHLGQDITMDNTERKHTSQVLGVSNADVASTTAIVDRLVEGKLETLRSDNAKGIHLSEEIADVDIIGNARDSLNNDRMYHLEEPGRRRDGRPFRKYHQVPQLPNNQWNELSIEEDIETGASDIDAIQTRLFLDEVTEGTAATSSKTSQRLTKASIALQSSEGQENAAEEAVSSLLSRTATASSLEVENISHVSSEVSPMGVRKRIEHTQSSAGMSKEQASSHTNRTAIKKNTQYTHLNLEKEDEISETLLSAQSSVGDVASAVLGLAGSSTNKEAWTPAVANHASEEMGIRENESLDNTREVLDNGSEGLGVLRSSQSSVLTGAYDENTSQVEKAAETITESGIETREGGSLDTSIVHEHIGGRAKASHRREESEHIDTGIYRKDMEETSSDKSVGRVLVAATQSSSKSPTSRESISVSVIAKATDALKNDSVQNDLSQERLEAAGEKKVSTESRARVVGNAQVGKGTALPDEISLASSSTEMYAAGLDPYDVTNTRGYTFSWKHLITENLHRNEHETSAHDESSESGGFTTASIAAVESDASSEQKRISVSGSFIGAEDMEMEKSVLSTHKGDESINEISAIASASTEATSRVDSASNSISSTTSYDTTRRRSENNSMREEKAENKRIHIQRGKSFIDSIKESESVEGVSSAAREIQESSASIETSAAVTMMPGGEIAENVARGIRTGAVLRAMSAEQSVENVAADSLETSTEYHAKRKKISAGEKNNIATSSKGTVDQAEEDARNIVSSSGTSSYSDGGRSYGKYTGRARTGEKSIGRTIEASASNEENNSLRRTEATTGTVVEAVVDQMVRGRGWHEKNKKRQETSDINSANRATDNLISSLNTDSVELYTEASGKKTASTSKMDVSEEYATEKSMHADSISNELKHHAKGSSKGVASVEVISLEEKSMLGTRRSKAQARKIVSAKAEAAASAGTVSIMNRVQSGKDPRESIIINDEIREDKASSGHEDPGEYSRGFISEEVDEEGDVLTETQVTSASLSERNVEDPTIVESTYFRESMESTTDSITDEKDTSSRATSKGFTKIQRFETGKSRSESATSSERYREDTRAFGEISNEVSLLKKDCHFITANDPEALIGMDMASIHATDVIVNSSEELDFGSGDMEIGSDADSLRRTQEAKYISAVAQKWRPLFDQNLEEVHTSDESESEEAAADRTIVNNGNEKSINKIDRGSSIRNFKPDPGRHTTLASAEYQKEENVFTHRNEVSREWSGKENTHPINEERDTEVIEEAGSALAKVDTAPTTTGGGVDIESNVGASTDLSRSESHKVDNALAFKLESSKELSQKRRVHYISSEENASPERLASTQVHSTSVASEEVSAEAKFISAEAAASESAVATEKYEELGASGRHSQATQTASLEMQEYDVEKGTGIEALATSSVEAEAVDVINANNKVKEKLHIKDQLVKWVNSNDESHEMMNHVNTVENLHSDTPHFTSSQSQSDFEHSSIKQALNSEIERENEAIDTTESQTIAAIKRQNEKDILRDMKVSRQLSTEKSREVSATAIARPFEDESKEMTDEAVEINTERNSLASTSVAMQTDNETSSLGVESTQVSRDELQNYANEEEQSAEASTIPSVEGKTIALSTYSSREVSQDIDILSELTNTEEESYAHASSEMHSSSAISSLELGSTQVSREELQYYADEEEQLTEASEIFSVGGSTTPLHSDPSGDVNQNIDITSGLINAEAKSYTSGLAEAETNSAISSLELGSTQVPREELQHHVSTDEQSTAAVTSTSVEVVTSPQSAEVAEVSNELNSGSKLTTSDVYNGVYRAGSLETQQESDVSGISKEQELLHAGSNTEAQVLASSSIEAEGLQVERLRGEVETHAVVMDKSETSAHRLETLSSLKSKEKTQQATRDFINEKQGRKRNMSSFISTEAEMSAASSSSEVEQVNRELNIINQIGSLPSRISSAVSAEFFQNPSISEISHKASYEKQGHHTDMQQIGPTKTSNTAFTTGATRMVGLAQLSNQVSEANIVGSFVTAEAQASASTESDSRENVSGLSLERSRNQSGQGNCHNFNCRANKEMLRDTETVLADELTTLKSVLSGEVPRINEGYLVQTENADVSIDSTIEITNEQDLRQSASDLASKLVSDSSFETDAAERSSISQEYLEAFREKEQHHLNTEQNNIEVLATTSAAVDSIVHTSDSSDQVTDVTHVQSNVVNTAERDDPILSTQLKTKLINIEDTTTDISNEPELGGTLVTPGSSVHQATNAGNYEGIDASTLEYDILEDELDKNTQTHRVTKEDSVEGIPTSSVSTGSVSMQSLYASNESSRELNIGNKLTHAGAVASTESLVKENLSALESEHSSEISREKKKHRISTERHSGLGTGIASSEVDSASMHSSERSRVKSDELDLSNELILAAMGQHAVASSEEQLTEDVSSVALELLQDISREKIKHRISIQKDIQPEEIAISDPGEMVANILETTNAAKEMSNELAVVETLSSRASQNDDISVSQSHASHEISLEESKYYTDREEARKLQTTSSSTGADTNLVESLAASLATESHEQKDISTAKSVKSYAISREEGRPNANSERGVTSVTAAAASTVLQRDKDIPPLELEQVMQIQTVGSSSAETDSNLLQSLDTSNDREEVYITGNLHHLASTELHKAVSNSESNILHETSRTDKYQRIKTRLGSSANGSTEMDTGLTYLDDPARKISDEFDTGSKLTHTETETYDIASAELQRDTSLSEFTTSPETSYEHNTHHAVESSTEIDEQLTAGSKLKRKETKSHAIISTKLQKEEDASSGADAPIEVDISTVKSANTPREVSQELNVGSANLVHENIGSHIIGSVDVVHQDMSDSESSDISLVSDDGGTQLHETTVASTKADVSAAFSADITRSTSEVLDTQSQLAHASSGTTAIIATEKEREKDISSVKLDVSQKMWDERKRHYGTTEMDSDLQEMDIASTKKDTSFIEGMIKQTSQELDTDESPIDPETNVLTSIEMHRRNDISNQVAALSETISRGQKHHPVNAEKHTEVNTERILSNIVQTNAMTSSQSLDIEDTPVSKFGSYKHRTSQGNIAKVKAAASNGAADFVGSLSASKEVGEGVDIGSQFPSVVTETDTVAATKIDVHDTYEKRTTEDPTNLYPPPFFHHKYKHTPPSKLSLEDVQPEENERTLRPIESSRPFYFDDSRDTEDEKNFSSGHIFAPSKTRTHFSDEISRAIDTTTTVNPQGDTTAALVLQLDDTDKSIEDHSFPKDIGFVASINATKFEESNTEVGLVSPGFHSSEAPREEHITNAIERKKSEASAIKTTNISSVETVGDWKGVDVQNNGALQISDRTADAGISRLEEILLYDTSIDESNEIDAATTSTIDREVGQVYNTSQENLSTTSAAVAEHKQNMDIVHATIEEINPVVVDAALEASNEREQEEQETSHEHKLINSVKSSKERIHSNESSSEHGVHMSREHISQNAASVEAATQIKETQSSQSKVLEDVQISKEQALHELASDEIDICSGIAENPSLDQSLSTLTDNESGHLVKELGGAMQEVSDEVESDISGVINRAYTVPMNSREDEIAIEADGRTVSTEIGAHHRASHDNNGEQMVDKSIWSSGIADASASADAITQAPKESVQTEEITDQHKSHTMSVETDIGVSTSQITASGEEKLHSLSQEVETSNERFLDRSRSSEIAAIDIGSARSESSASVEAVAQLESSLSKEKWTSEEISKERNEFDSSTQIEIEPPDPINPYPDVRISNEDNGVISPLSTIDDGSSESNKNPSEDLPWYKPIVSPSAAETPVVEGVLREESKNDDMPNGPKLALVPTKKGILLLPLTAEASAAADASDAPELGPVPTATIAPGEIQPFEYPKTDIYIVRTPTTGPVRITHMTDSIPPLVSFRLIPKEVYEQVRNVVRQHQTSYNVYPMSVAPVHV